MTRKSSPRQRQKSSRPGDRKEPGAGPARRNFPALNRQRVVQVLSTMEEGCTATRLAAELHLPGEAAREASLVLRELAQEGVVIESRPGRFVVAGADGEHRVQVEAAPDGSLIGVMTDGQRLPIHPRHALGAAAGDVGIALCGEDGHLLLVRLLRRGGARVLGTLQFHRQEIRLVPDNRREDPLVVQGANWKVIGAYEAGQRVVGILKPAADGSSVVEIERILDEATPEIADFEQVVLQHDLPGAFAPAVIAEAEGWSPNWALEGRRDCTKDEVFTIDPVTAKDFDDAIAVTKRPDGGWSVAVHIADVSHFVTQNSALDNEAAFRGTSCYLINRVIPMLPEVLSNGWCSLVPHEPRYALSVFIELDARLNIERVTPDHALICSRARLTYEQAQAIIDGSAGDDSVPEGIAEAIRRAHILAQGLRAQRVRRGAINLFSVEHRFQLDVEGRPIEVESEGHNESHQLIEELMLLANRTVATWLAERNRHCVYRVHGEPDPERLEFFNGLCHAYGLTNIRVEDRATLQAALARIDQEPPTARLVLNSLCLRCFRKAVYQVKNIGHYALAFSHYAHFTSPIRRYPDLLVHRLVKHELGLSGYANSETRMTHLDALARQCSFLERRAEDAERALRGIKAARYLQTRLGDAFAAVVMGAAPSGLFVQLLETGLDGFIPVRDLGADYFTFDGERQALVGRNTQAVFGVGREIDVQVAAVDIPRGEVTLTIAQENRQEPLPQPEVPAPSRNQEQDQGGRRKRPGKRERQGGKGR